MKRMFFYGILIFVFSFGIGYYCSTIWKMNKQQQTESLIEANLIKNENVIETSQIDERISYNAEFALKKYFDECGHFSFKYAELPKELINKTRMQIEELYDEWEIEEFSKDHLVLSQEINSICEEHYLIKLVDNNVQIFHVGNGASLSLYKETDISKEYLTSEDIQTLEEGILVYGAGKLNSIIEDFE